MMMGAVVSEVFLLKRIEFYVTKKERSQTFSQDEEEAKKSKECCPTTA